MIGTRRDRLTMKEAAQYLGHSYSWLFTRHRSLGLCGYRIGGRWFFDLEDIQNWEAGLKQETEISNSSHGLVRSKSKRVRFV